MIPLLDWIPRRTVVLALGLSAGITLGSLFLAPLAIARLPADYFLERRQRAPEDSRSPYPVIHYTVVSLKNLLGVALLVVGTAMVPFPGQGLLTMVVGLSLVDFPGKHHLVTAVGRSPVVLRSLNWFRARAHKAPFLTPATA